MLHAMAGANASTRLLAGADFPRRALPAGHISFSSMRKPRAGGSGLSAARSVKPDAMNFCRFDRTAWASAGRRGARREQRRWRDTGAALAARSRDPFILNFRRVLAAAKSSRQGEERSPSRLKLLSPVANPSKIIGAPINYDDHISRVGQGPGIAHGRTNIQNGHRRLGPVPQGQLVAIGLREKSAALARRAQRPRSRARGRDRQARQQDQPREKALEYVCAYSIGLDMTVRGRSCSASGSRSTPTAARALARDRRRDRRSQRPRSLDQGNGELRRIRSRSISSTTSSGLIEFASAMYTLHPGDIIMTGTPAGVSR